MGVGLCVEAYALWQAYSEARRTDAEAGARERYLDHLQTAARASR